MKIPNAQLLTLDQVTQVLAQANAEGWNVSYLPQKHQLLIERGSDWLAKLFLPWTSSWDTAQGISTNPDAHFSLVLVRAGQAAVGYFHQGQLIDHKVIRAYMVRQKQGKSQFKYLKTKGKSRAGSRIRLAETLLFFNEINKKLNTELSKILKTDNISINFSGSVYNRNLLQQSNNTFNINQTDFNVNVPISMFKDRFVVTLGSTLDVPLQSTIQQNVQFHCGT